MREKERAHQLQMADCRDDGATLGGRDLNDSILSGNVAVKVIRVPTGRLVGPGSYEPDKPRVAGSYNLKGEKRFQELSRKSPANRGNATFRTNISRILKNSSENLTIPPEIEDKPRSRPSFSRLLNIRNEVATSTRESQNTTESSESSACVQPVREFRACPSPRSSTRPKEYYRLLFPAGKSSRENVVTPNFCAGPDYSAILSIYK